MGRLAGVEVGGREGIRIMIMNHTATRLTRRPGRCAFRHGIDDPRELPRRTELARGPETF